jgi:hypothetical protein
MKPIFDLINHRTQFEMENHSFINWLKTRTDSTSARDKLLLWLPHLITFSMGYKDFNHLILKYPTSTTNGEQKPLISIINEHAEEDGEHWKWLMEDVKTLGANQELDLVSFLSFFWGEQVEGLYLFWNDTNNYFGAKLHIVNALSVCPQYRCKFKKTYSAALRSPIQGVINRKFSYL